MDFDAIMEKAYEEYFEGLAEGEEALSFSEFKQALSSSAKANNWEVYDGIESLFQTLNKPEAGKER